MLHKSPHVSHYFDYVKPDYDVAIQDMHPEITRKISLFSTFSGLLQINSDVLGTGRKLI
jgi:hypothetical protein